MRKNSKKLKQIIAWIIILLLVFLIAATFVFALIDTPWASDAFKMCLGFIIVIPVLIYVYLMIYRLQNRNDDEKQTTGDNDD